jgi:hypothetical protein
MRSGSIPEPQSLDIYLNDHLAGATGACELARNTVEKYASTPNANFLREFLDQLEEDRAMLEDMIKTLGGTPNPLKQAGAWIMEKVSRFKLSPGGTDSEELSALLTIETLCIGVEGKICLWTALKHVAGDMQQLNQFDLDGLLARAKSQRAGLEKERLVAARAALPARAGAPR